MADMTDDEKALATCEAELKTLDTAINDRPRDRKLVRDAAKGASTDNFPKLKPVRKPAPDGKLAGLSWMPTDDAYVLSILQDGRLIIWDVKRTAKVYFIAMNSYLVCGGFSADGKHMAIGGLDNVVSVFTVPDLKGEFDPVSTETPNKKERHTGFIADIKYLGNDMILSGGGDKSVMLWDANKAGLDKDPVSTFTGHGMCNPEESGGDVLSIATHPGETNTFLTGSSDSYVKLWDRRMPTTSNQCAMTYAGHSYSVTTIKYMPSGNAFVTASDDGTCGVFDLRCQARVQQLAGPGSGDRKTRKKYTAITVSASGRYVLSGNAVGSIHVWDLLNLGDKPNDELVYHTENNDEGAIVALETAPTGTAIISGMRAKTKNMAIWA